MPISPSIFKLMPCIEQIVDKPTYLFALEQIADFVERKRQNAKAELFGQDFYNECVSILGIAFEMQSAATMKYLSLPT